MRRIPDLRFRVHEHRNGRIAAFFCDHDVLYWIGSRHKRIETDASYMPPQKISLETYVGLICFEFRGCMQSNR